MVTKLTTIITYILPDLKHDVKYDGAKLQIFCETILSRYYLPFLHTACTQNSSSSQSWSNVHSPKVKLRNVTKPNIWFGYLKELQWWIFQYKQKFITGFPVNARIRGRKRIMSPIWTKSEAYIVAIFVVKSPAIVVWITRRFCIYKWAVDIIGQTSQTFRIFLRVP